MESFVSNESLLLHNDVTTLLRRWSRKKLIEDVKQRMECPETIIDPSENLFFIQKKSNTSFLEKFMKYICCKNFD